MKALPRVGLIGFGRIGAHHAQTLLGMPDRCTLAIIADAYPDALVRAREQYPWVRCTTDVADVFEDPHLDAVVIASSTSTHAGFIVAAARSGKDAFTEKPIALDLETTDQALEAIRTSGTRLQVGFQRRFDPAYAEAFRAIRGGELGRTTMIRDAMRDPAPPPLAYLESSGGLFRDMTIHNFDCVRWLMGEEPVALTAIGTALVSDDARSIGDVDTSIVTLRFPSGAMASIENSRQSSFGYDVRTEVFGTSGALFIDDSRRTAIRRLDGEGVHEDHRSFFIDRFATAYRRELDAFVGAVAHGRPVVPDGADGRSALLLAELAEQSLAAGRSVPVSGAGRATQEVSTTK